MAWHKLGGGLLMLSDDTQSLFEQEEYAVPLQHYSLSLVCITFIMPSGRQGPICCRGLTRQALHPRSSGGESSRRHFVSCIFHSDSAATFDCYGGIHT